MAADLHTHSTASDGSDSPTELVQRAVDRGLTVLALTDHDTVDGVAEAREAARGPSLELVPGVELSLGHENGALHVVVLWLEPGSGPLQDTLAGLRSGRDERNAAIAGRLTELGMSVTIEEINDQGGGGSVGRPHIAAVMVDKGYVPDIRTAFDLWLARGRPAYVERPRLDAEEALILARQSGAVPVLAHPHTLGIHTSSEMAGLLIRLRQAGLVGLEAYYASYRRHEQEGYADLARRFGLIPSGGSDYHGSYKPELDLGSGDLPVPYSLVEELKAQAS